MRKLLKSKKGFNEKLLRIPNSFSRMLSSKRAFNDMSILFTIFLLFVFLGTIIPFVNSAFDQTGTTNDIDGVVSDVGQDQTITSISSITIIGSIFKMFFWSFGDLVWWLDMLLIPLRLLFAITLARNIWVGGGA